MRRGEREESDTRTVVANVSRLYCVKKKRKNSKTINDKVTTIKSQI